MFLTHDTVTVSDLRSDLRKALPDVVFGMQRVSFCPAQPKPLSMQAPVASIRLEA